MAAPLPSTIPQAQRPDPSGPAQGAPTLPSYESYSRDDQDIITLVQNGLSRYPGHRCPLSDVEWRKFFSDEAQFRRFLQRWGHIIGCDGHWLWLRPQARPAPSAPPGFERSSDDSGEEFDEPPPSSSPRPGVPEPPWKRRASVAGVPSKPDESRPPVTPQRKFSVDAQRARPPASPPGEFRGSSMMSGREKYLGFKITRLEGKLEKATKNLTKFRTHYQNLVHQLTCSICMEPAARMFENTCCITLCCDRCAQLQRPCPKCGKSCDWQLSPVLSRIVAKVRVDCPLGCGDEVTYGELEHHKSVDCLSAIVPCPHYGCQVKLRRRHLERHALEECPFTNKPCDPTKCNVCALREGKPITEARQLRYMIDERWWRAFTSFAENKGGMRQPPGPITNSNLLSGGHVKPGLKLDEHYRSVSAEEWNYVESTFGGGPPIVREVDDIYAQPIIVEPSEMETQLGEESSGREEVEHDMRELEQGGDQPRQRQKPRKRKSKSKMETPTSPGAESFMARGPDGLPLSPDQPANCARM